MSAPRGSAVRLEGVSKLFGEVRAVEDLSFDVREGEFFALLGPSGCGKTTTLKMIGGFEQPTQGQVLIHGQAVNQVPPFKRNVNTVFQNYALFPHLNVAENVGFGLRMKGTPRRERVEAVREALRRVHLEGIGGRATHELSGGQQQRVALARALVNRPAVLLLDEPLGALDLKLRKSMQLELKSIQEQVGISFIYVTHDQEEALTMADRIAVMDGGRALQIGTPSEIYERPTTRMVADFIGESSFLQGRVEHLESGQVTVLLDGGMTVLARAQGASAGSSVTVAVRPEKVTVAPGNPHPSDNGATGTNELGGIIEDIIYAGSDTRYFIRTGTGLLHARVANDSSESAHTTLERGSPVVAAFAVSATVVLVN